MNMNVPNRSIRICADRGGTFCDVHAYVSPPAISHVPTYILKSSFPDPNDSSADRKEIVVKLRKHRVSQPLLTLVLTEYAPVSQDPGNYADAPTEGIRRVLEIVTGEQIPRGQKLPTDKIGACEASLQASICMSAKLAAHVDYIRLSTTVATNALLERKGHKHALVITKGFKVSFGATPEHIPTSQLNRRISC